MDFDRIYFDMDGVLADFDRGVRDMCQMEAGDQEAPDREEHDDLMFAAIAATPHFYLRLEPIGGMLEILKGLIDQEFSAMLCVVIVILLKENGTELQVFA